LEANFKKVLNRLKSAIEKSGREAGSVELLAVSKKHPIESILKLNSLGQKRFGENYPSELFDKASKLKDQKVDVDWVFIGSLQSNKIAKLVEICSEIQTVASLKHLRYIDRYAKEQGKKEYPVYLQINLSEEPQKSGFKLSEITDAYEFISSSSSIDLKGLMAIPAREDSQKAAGGQVPESYTKIKQSCEKLKLNHLSLGMSTDLESAVEAGSTCVRIGTDIFGTRPS
jgi:pyridoxal phosphate enzyme (YggS family)